MWTKVMIKMKSANLQRKRRAASRNNDGRQGLFFCVKALFTVLITPACRRYCEGDSLKQSS
jgi:hypothetical protein